MFLYNAHTLELLAKKAGMKIRYIKYIQRYTIANHLHWLAKNRPNGHREWSFLDADELNKAHENVLSSLGLTDTIVTKFY